jgi:hypothetical protein
MPICAFLKPDGTGLDYRPDTDLHECIQSGGVVVMSSADVDAMNQSWLPQLDAAGGASIGAAIALVWAVAHGFKMMRVAAEQSFNSGD